ncbi:YitT family ABC transporter [Spiroplasma apis]|uniref:YitT family protein n=1 Tax=Spiroplasma apis B31 TaxID=1276258 RepID=V5RJH3_SPIAP|nr:YitT family ABC transporter [Spiroplasma apis]AHB36261.1 hypothetical protein SAPIS_v1c04150 [Spiroplasma apis B31]
MNDDILNDKATKTLEDLVIDEPKESFHSKSEQRTIKKAAKELAKNEGNTIELSNIESIVMSKREQRLLVQEYFKSKFWRELGKLALAALMITITFDYFISATGRTGLFPAGVGAIARFLAILTFPTDIGLQSSFYFIYYFTINIPLMIFGYFKLGKKFTFTTVLFIILQIAFDQILQIIPFFNPTDFHIIINFSLIQNLSNSWNTSIWLFIFGSLGGVLLGASYSIVYKIGSSSGGADFLTIFFSKIKNKPVGNLNRNANFMILGFIIIMNSIILPASMLSAEQKMNALYNLSVDDAFQTYTKDGKNLIESLFEYVLGKDNRGPAYLDPAFSKYFDLLGDAKAKEIYSVSELIDYLVSKQPDNNYLYRYLVQLACNNGFGENLAGWTLVKVKLTFIFGPSLFASIVLILCSSATTNALYPKFKLRTYLITTNQPKEINNFFLERGFQNDIVTWDGTNRINKNYLHRSVIMVAMSVMDWDSLEKEVFLIDPQAKINILKTKAVKGIFNYEIKKNDERDFIHRKINSDEMELEKIRQIAIVKLNRETERQNRKNNKKRRDNISLDKNGFVRANKHKNNRMTQKDIYDE